MLTSRPDDFAPEQRTRIINAPNPLAISRVVAFTCKLNKFVRDPNIGGQLHELVNVFLEDLSDLNLVFQQGEYPRTPAVQLQG